MIVTIKNFYLKQSIDLFFNLPLKGKQSRHRTKFIKLLREQLKEVEEQRKQLNEEFAKKDEEGNPIIKDGYYVIGDMDEFRKEYNELMNEELVIDGGNHQEMLITIKAILLNCDEYFSGEQAEVYNYLCEQFEKGEDHA